MLMMDTEKDFCFVNIQLYLLVENTLLTSFHTKKKKLPEALLHSRYLQQSELLVKKLNESTSNMAAVANFATIHA